MKSTSCAAKKEFWLSLLAEKDQSSLSVAEFCSEKDASLQAFYQWRRRIQQPEGAVSKATSLLPVRVVPLAILPFPPSIQIVTASASDKKSVGPCESGVFLRIRSQGYYICVNLISHQLMVL